MYLSIQIFQSVSYLSINTDIPVDIYHCISLNVFICLIATFVFPFVYISINTDIPVGIISPRLFQKSELSHKTKVKSSPLNLSPLCLSLELVLYYELLEDSSLSPPSNYRQFDEKNYFTSDPKKKKKK